MNINEFIDKGGSIIMFAQSSSVYKTDNWLPLGAVLKRNNQYYKKLKGHLNYSTQTII